MYNSILCRYNEIATKGNNRSMFENRLVQNMRQLCKDVINTLRIVKTRGRIFIHKEGFAPFTEEEIPLISERLKRCFGLASFSFCHEAERSLDAVKKIITDNIGDVFAKYEKEGHAVRFRSRVRRADKTFPIRSRDMEIEIATLIESLIGENKVKLDLDDPEISIGVEIRETNALVFLETIEAAGGLPVGSNSPVLALLSGGIDSPVACVMAMKRGCRCDYLTFHSYPYTPMESVDKVRRLAAIINQWQPRGVLYACNIAELQKLIRDNCDPRYRTVLYRRMMMRIASMLCKRKKLYAIVTGEAIGQVASQTILNMSVIDQTVPTLVVRPLCGMDKNETIRRAEELGTFNVSIEPMADSCTVFAPDSPVTNAKLHTVEFEESKIPDLNDALEAAYKTIETVE